MAKALSPIRILRSRRVSFQNTEETHEIDFGLSLKQGVNIYGVEFGIENAVLVPSTTPLTRSVHLSLHVETGTLEGAIDAGPVDTTILASEIIAETVYQVTAGDTIQIEGEKSQEWLMRREWDYLSIFGKPLLVAQNVTFRGVTSGSELTCNGALVVIFYQYVQLTDKELVEQFALRR